MLELELKELSESLEDEDEALNLEAAAAAFGPENRGDN